METESRKRCPACDQFVTVTRGQMYCHNCERDRKHMLLQAIELKRKSTSHVNPSTSMEGRPSGGNLKEVSETEQEPVRPVHNHDLEAIEETQTDETDARFETADANPDNENHTDKKVRNHSIAIDRLERRTAARKKRERLFKEFKNIADVDLSKYRNFGADCRHCGKEIRSGTKNTKPFLNHLEKAHPEVYASLDPEKRRKPTTKTSNGARNPTTRMSRKKGKALVTTSKTTRTSTRESSTGVGVITTRATRRTSRSNRSGMTTYMEATRTSVKEFGTGITTTRATTKTSRTETSIRAGKGGANKTWKKKIPESVTGTVGAETSFEEMYDDAERPAVEEDIFADYTSEVNDPNNNQTETIAQASSDGRSVLNEIITEIPANEPEITPDKHTYYTPAIPVDNADNDENEIEDPMPSCSNSQPTDSDTFYQSIVSEFECDFYNALADYFMQTHRDASEVELPVFKRLIKVANPWIDLPSEKDLRSCLDWLRCQSQ